MDAGVKLPVIPSKLPGWSQIVEWRAGRIQDPIEKLRFLRRVQAVSERGLHVPVISRRILRGTMLAGLLLIVPLHSASDAVIAFERFLREPLTASDTSDYYPSIWLVESFAGQEYYSNGLQVENRFLAKPSPEDRIPFQRFDRETGELVDAPGPAGIVFHTTESLIAPFEEEENRRLRWLGQQLLKYVRNHRSYHFVVDRFGRVFRTVPENERANHAGNSVWADSRFYYVNLNSSFLSVAFEAQTRDESGQHTASPAQVHAARILTQMLRSRYRIPALNCVTHAQVSVNPGNRYVGYHTDWATNFPFEAIGLTDNYQILLPSVAEFGFTRSPELSSILADKPWIGLVLADEQVRQQAASEGSLIAHLRHNMQRRYREMRDAVKAASAATEERD